MNKGMTRTYVQLAVIFIATLFISIGVFREEVQEVFVKAIWICMECVGIG